jgi:hypothetical protein
METFDQRPHKVPQGGFALRRPCENKDETAGTIMNIEIGKICPYLARLM